MFIKLRVLFLLTLIISIYIIEFYSNQSYSPQFIIDEKKEKYLKKFNELKNNYTNNEFLNDFLNEISLFSYDYSPSLNNENKEINIIININNKYIYPSLVSINSALNNSHTNKTTLI